MKLDYVQEYVNYEYAVKCTKRIPMLLELAQLSETIVSLCGKHSAMEKELHSQLENANIDFPSEVAYNSIWCKLYRQKYASLNSEVETIMNRIAELKSSLGIA